MRTFEKSSKLDNVCYDIRGPVMDEANRMIAAGEDILKLNIGNPAPFGFRAPDEIIAEMKRELVGAEGYSDSKGLVKAREAIVKYDESKGFPEVDINDVYTGNGASELISLSMNALLNNGDEILVPAPDYPLWTASVTLSGGTAVHYICDERSNWYPDINDIRSKITDKTKGIVIINPNNPTGSLYPESVLEEIIRVARENDLILFSDEIYDRLVMDEKKHTSTAALAPDVPVITFNGLSKSHLIAGFRCGWMTISGDRKKIAGYIEGINLLSSMRLCSNVQAQSIIPKALDMLYTTDELIVPGGRVYEQREIIYNAISDIPGLSAYKPDAAFYIFPKMDIKKFNIKDDEKFAVDFLRDQHILVTHGGGFHWTEPDHFRIVYLPGADQLNEAMRRTREFFANYVQE
ncbi:MAG: aminotransferase class I/II-fold pyridoxal phosphate-dependent enzyme [Clostridiales bacterium]|nr:aminotransferase class I/II-fold pyridoxal phosphate-dependent enzyme [Clostridiales bacterium]MBS5877408.1 aminotransferase class I/II-fold pyridoxal phosphate-dependent enzyme [Clostridiales bacterium]MDU0938744.1 aminotransferase class I/II-fold pyridoxal phosphate-dependent enzyme [Clostridiales bacterium]MDU1041616.1 aminotransferase class I/II-fold pyridoxal phosphate-dependent enzyme [Clostridiales bacterium]